MTSGDICYAGADRSSPRRSAMMFVRDKSPGSISLADLLPESDDGRRSVLEELEELVAYHRRKAVKMHSSLCRRFAGDVDGDDPVVVQGDGEPSLSLSQCSSAE